MLFETGFLGTKAPFYLDLITCYFAFLPFLLAYSIRFAVKKEFKKHFTSQSIILAFTLVIVLFFEVSIRLDGGFAEYVKHTDVSKNFLVIYLVIHIIIAIAAIAGWLYLYISAYKAYKTDKTLSSSPNHKRIGKAIFASLTLTCILGIGMYFFLFV